MNNILWRTVFCLVLSAAIYSCAPGKEEKDVESYLKARDLYDKGCYVEAGEILNNILKKDKRFHQARILLGKRWFMDKEYEKAEQEFARTIKLFGFHPEAKAWLVRAKLQNGEPERALSEVKSALAVDPDNPVFLELAASIYGNLGQLDYQLEFLKSAARSSQLLARVHLELGRIYYSVQDIPKALNELQYCDYILEESSVLKNPVRQLLEYIKSEQSG